MAPPRPLSPRSPRERVRSRGGSAHATSTELLRSPSDWYLTGFLVPEDDREPPPDELEGPGEGDDVQKEDADDEEPATKRPKLFPASMGMSVLLPPADEVDHVTAHVSFARYDVEWVEEDGQGGRGRKFWRRVPQPTQVLRVPLDPDAIREGISLLDTPKIRLEGRLATFEQALPGIAEGTRALSLFLVNRDGVQEDDLGRVGRTLFQVQLELECASGFVRRPEFHWSPKKKAARRGQQLDLFDRELADSLSEALAARERIAEFSRYDTAEANRDMRDAEDALSRLRLIGDVLIGAFFAEKKPKARETERKRRKGLIERWLLDERAIAAPEELVALAEQARARFIPFHWMLEFPEVFWAGRVDPLTGKAEEEPAYLDAVIGNPPFAGKNSIANAYDGAPILDWFKTLHPGAHGNADGTRSSPRTLATPSASFPTSAARRSTPHRSRPSTGT